MKVVGMDPGLRNFGICVAEVHPTNGTIEFEKMTTITTSPCADVTKAQDIIMRGEQLAADLEYFVSEGKWCDVFAVCVEGFSRPPSHTSAIMLGVANGVVASLLSQWVPEVIYIRSPQAIRKSLIELPKNKTPSEESVHLMLSIAFDEVASWLKTSPKYMHEHVMDAVAAVTAARKEGALLP